jgi:membrane-associated phospholipid phosphatase
MIPVWLIVFALLILLLTSLDVANQGLLTDLDHAVGRQMVRWDLRHGWTKPLIYVLTLFGQRGTVLGVSIPLTGYLVWRQRSLEPLLRYAVALVLLTIAVYAIKDGLHRTAPPVDVVRTSAGASYPSGHIANAAIVWGTTWWSARQIDSEAMLTRVLNVVRWAGPVSVVIGMTLLNYHWISDFIAGACVAVVVLAVVTLPGWRRPARWADQRLWPARPVYLSDVPSV